jgi:DNA-binding response OmpR family regulator
LDISVVYERVTRLVHRAYNSDTEMDERILIVEDEKNLAEALSYNLRQEGWVPQVAATGEEALEHFRNRPPDLVLLDWMLPGLSGLEVCRRMRVLADTPILMLTARGEEREKVQGLELGADDYITKPFSLAELKARIRVQLRKRSKTDSLILGRLTIDQPKFQATKDNQLLNLTKKEFLLLWELASHAGIAIPSEALLRRVWGNDFFGEDQTLQVHIRRLRQKIEDDPSQPTWIRTIRGVGYKFQP